MRKTIVAGVLLLCACAGPASASILVQYDPVGDQASNIGVSPSSLAPGLAASDLTQTGFEDFWENSGVWPVGRISDSPTIVLSQYVTFTLTGQFSLDTLSYDGLSYLNAGPTFASVRSSLDGFAADVASQPVDPSSGVRTLSFDISALQNISGALEMRLYFYGSPSDLTDWMDLASSERGFNGLTVHGSTVPTPATFVLLGLGLLGVAHRRRQH
jgi:hypothetical protein